MRTSTFILLFALLLGSIFQGCVTAPDFPDEPVITFAGLSRTQMDQGSLNQDSLTVFFTFTDGDGDLGTEINNGTRVFDLFLIDSRTGNEAEKFALPYVPPKGANNGISGNGRFVVFNTCCLYPDGSPGCEPNPDFPTTTFEYEIYIVDRAGNESNRIFTGPITLNCI